MATKGEEQFTKMDQKNHKSNIPLAERLTKSADASGAFTFEQKMSMIQSILQTIPHEKEKPRNPKKQQSNPLEDNTTLPDVSGRTKSADPKTVNKDLLDAKHVPSKSEPNPLPDPYAKSMKYYEKHLILNNFQHMTAKLVLQRPTNALNSMIEWCKEMQAQHKPLPEITTEQLYEPDVKKETTQKAEEQYPDKSFSFQSFGNERTLKTTTPVATRSDSPDNKLEEIDEELTSFGHTQPPMVLQDDDDADIESEGSITPHSGNTVSPTSLSEASDLSINS